MSDQIATAIPAAEHDDDSAKRRQILDGAAQVFLERGFDAASMGEIARAAGVSKGTLYVYFDNKEMLFNAIVQQERRGQAETIFQLDPADHDVAAVLTRFGIAFVSFLCDPRRISPVRTVIAIGSRMPEAGRAFYDSGPGAGIARLAAYLGAQNEAAILNVADCEVAAAQFMDACQSTLFKPVLFGFGDAPSPERIAYVVGIAVRTFMAAYQAR